MIAGMPEGSPNRRALEMAKTSMMAQAGGIGGKESAKMANTGAVIAGNMEGEGQRQGNRMELQDKRHTDRLSEIEARAKKKAAVGAKSAGKFANENTSIDKLLEPKDRNQILNQFRATETKIGRLDKVIQSYRRLKVAKMEIDEPNSPEARFAKLETFLNQFGVIREGVPVKHETDFVFVNSLYEKMKLELSGLVGQPIPDSTMAAVEKANSILMRWCEKNVTETATSMKEGYDGFSQPARKYAQNLANTVLVKSDMRPVQLWPDTPLNSAGRAEQPSASPAQPAQTGAAPKKGATESLLESLGIQ
jgi:hypothetical protein